MAHRVRLAAVSIVAVLITGCMPPPPDSEDDMDQSEGVSASRLGLLVDLTGTGPLLQIREPSRTISIFGEVADESGAVQVHQVTYWDADLRRMANVLQFDHAGRITRFEDLSRDVIISVDWMTDSTGLITATIAGEFVVEDLEVLLPSDRLKTIHRAQPSGHRVDVYVYTNTCARFVEAEVTVPDPERPFEDATRAILLRETGPRQFSGSVTVYPSYVLDTSECGVIDAIGYYVETVITDPLTYLCPAVCKLNKILCVACDSVDHFTDLKDALELDPADRDCAEFVPVEGIDHPAANPAPIIRVFAYGELTLLDGTTELVTGRAAFALPSESGQEAVLFLDASQPDLQYCGWEITCFGGEPTSPFVGCGWVAPPRVTGRR